MEISSGRSWRFLRSEDSEDRGDSPVFQYTVRMVDDTAESSEDSPVH